MRQGIIYNTARICHAVEVALGTKCLLRLNGKTSHGRFMRRNLQKIMSIKYLFSCLFLAPGRGAIYLPHDKE